MENTTLCEFRYNSLIRSNFSKDGAKVLFQHLNDGTDSFMIKGDLDAMAICAYYKEVTLVDLVQEALDFYDGDYCIEATPKCIEEEFLLFGTKIIAGFTTNDIISIVFFDFDFACSCYLLDQPTVEST